MPKISIIVCTHNRASLLDRLLDSLSRQALDKSHWGIVVVDNNSPDNTKDIVEEWQRRFSVKYVKESRLGLSYARNTGIQQSNSDYLLYLDDDVYAESGLLKAYFDFVNSADMSNIACLGGKVIVEWEGGQKPTWFPARFENLYGLNDLGDQMVDSNVTVGCNMLWRREALLTLGGFDVGLGRKGNIKLAAEETLLVQDALQRGYKIKYIPDAIVHHWAPWARQSRKYLFEICYGLGRSKTIVETDSSMKLSSSVTLKKYAKLPLNFAIYLWRFLISCIKNMRFLSEPDAVYWLGMLFFVVGDVIQTFQLKLKDRQ